MFVLVSYFSSQLLVPISLSSNSAAIRIINHFIMVLSYVACTVDDQAYTSVYFLCLAS